MDYKYRSSVRQLTARPRSKRLRELGGTIVNDGSLNVSVVGGNTATVNPNGHIHTNLDVLERIATDDEDYICLNEYIEETDPDTGEETGNFTAKKERAKVGFADLAGALAEEAMGKLMEMFLRKDRDEKTSYLLSLLGGAIIKNWAKFGEFVTGVQGGYIDENGHMEMESGVFRKRVFIPEIAYNRITYFKGRSCISPGGGCTVLSYVSNNDGSYTITPDLTEADGLSQFVDDILTTYFILKNEEGKLQGFEEMKFRVTSVDYDAKKFVVKPKPGYDYRPAEQMILAQTGNFTDEERQNYILIDTVNGNSCITFYDRANTWETEPAQEPSWFGKKKGRTVAGINCDNYSAVLQNILMTGRIFQIDEITGSPVRVPIDKGAWVPGQNAYFDRVTHIGRLWLCVNEKGTTSEPSEDNPDWLMQVDRGASVQSEGEWRAEKTPLPANAIATFAGGAFITKRETSVPPIACWKISDDTYAMMDDGAYVLMGSWNEYGHTDDWNVLLHPGTIVNGKDGTSIAFLGSYATHPANPKEGWAYYNTTDKCSYVYQTGTWRVMVHDGSDGTDYEWIYCRTKVEESPAQPYSDPDTDDYVPPTWTDDPVGINEEYRYEWACKRMKTGGKWGDWSKVALVFRYADKGKDGTSLTPLGDWSEKLIPVATGGVVSFAGATYAAKTSTSVPPIACWKLSDDTYARMDNGAYVLMGGWDSYGHKNDWQQIASDGAAGKPGNNGSNGADAVSYWIDIPISAIHFTSTGSPSPSSFLATCKKGVGDVVSECSDYFLVARRLKDNTWSSAVSATKGKSISISAAAGYTQWCVRAYKTADDANNWRENYVAEKGVTVATDGGKGDSGAPGPAGSFPYDAGVFETGKSYVWNSTKRDKIIHAFNGVYYNFLVKTYGSTVSAAPTSAAGDSNWEAMNKMVNIATDTLFADGANVAGFMFKNGVMRSHKETNGVANMILNGQTGYFHCNNVDISGIVNATSGTFNGTVNASGGRFRNITVESATVSGDMVVGDSYPVRIKPTDGAYSSIEWDGSLLKLGLEIFNGNISGRISLEDIIHYGALTKVLPNSIDVNGKWNSADDHRNYSTHIEGGLLKMLSPFTTTPCTIQVNGAGKLVIYSPSWLAESEAKTGQVFKDGGGYLKIKG